MVNRAETYQSTRRDDVAFEPRARFDAFVERAQSKKEEDPPRTIPEQKDVQAWQEINRQRSLGRSDSDIFSNAVREGDLEIAGAMIRQPPPGFDINKKNAQGQTALHQAMFSDNAREMVELLVNEGHIDLAVRDNTLQSGYDIAIKYGNKNNQELKGVAAFLKEKLNAAAETAYRNNDTERLEALRAAGADPVDEKKIAEQVNKEWFKAVEDGDLQKIREFIEKKPKGWDITAKDKNGQTALHKAIFAKNPKEVVKLLVEEGKIDMAVRDNILQSAYDIAVKFGNKNQQELKDVAAYLRGKLTEEAGVAARNGDRGRLDALLQAGADKPKVAYVAGDPLNEYTARPKGDNRSAEQIIKDNPLLAQLSEVDKKALGDKVGGDITQDADAAFRAAQVLHRIEGYDANGNQIFSGDVGNGRIDGWSKSDRTNPKNKAGRGTEAERFQNFIKDGWSSLKGGSTRSAEQVIRDNPLLDHLSERDKQDLINKFGDYTKDAKLAELLARALDHIERYNSEGGGETGKQVGNGRIDGWSKADRNDPKNRAEGDSEAERFEAFMKSDKPFETLKNFKKTDTKESVQGALGELKQEVYEKIIRDAKLPEDRYDMVKHPEKYTKEQRFAAQIEITLAIKTMQEGASKYFSNRDGKDMSTYIGKSGWNNDYYVDGKGYDYSLADDPKYVVEEAQKAIDLLNSPEVEEYGSTAFTTTMQTLLADNPALREQVEAAYKAMKDKAVGLEEYVGEGKNTAEGMGAYLQEVQQLNDALGTNGKPLDDNLVINIKDSPQFETITKAYEAEVRDPNALTNLVNKYTKEGKSREDAEKLAFAQFNSNMMLYSSYGSPTDEISSVAQENINKYVMGSATVDDLYKSPLIKENGELDEDLLLKSLEDLQKKDPGNFIFKNEDGGVMNPGQIVLAVKGTWDGIRNLGKVNDKIGNVREIPLNQLFDKNGKYQSAIFAKGIMHIGSAVLGAGVIAARMGWSKTNASPAEIAATIGVGIQMVGVSTQGFEFTQRPNPKIQWGNILKPGVGVTPPMTTVKQDLMNAGKTLNGLGGLINGAAGIAMGIQQLRAGNKGAGAVALTLGVSNTVTALGPLAEAGTARLWKGLDAAARTSYTARLFVWGGLASFGLNVVGLLAAIGGTIYGLVSQINFVKDQKHYFGSFVPELNKYHITGNSLQYKWPTPYPG